MFHTHFHKIVATNHQEFGHIKGELFKTQAQESFQKQKSTNYWVQKVQASYPYFQITKQYYPHLIEEIEGYAKASEIPLEEFWTMSLEDELDFVESEKCTSFVTNDGKLTSHNEDWAADAKDAICVLQKTVGDVATLELYYYNTLGGVSCTVNSHGIVMMINTLNQDDRQVGVPRNVIARVLSETQNVETDCRNLKDVPRSQGYNHIFVTSQGAVFDLETTAQKQELINPVIPFVHTNHYLSANLKAHEKTDNSSATFQRYEEGCKKIKSAMTIQELKALNSDDSQGGQSSIMNERTIGKMEKTGQRQQARGPGERKGSAVSVDAFQSRLPSDGECKERRGFRRGSPYA
jgi:predicted choloylglycine hydrolase